MFAVVGYPDTPLIHWPQPRMNYDAKNHLRVYSQPNWQMQVCNLIVVSAFIQAEFKPAASLPMKALVVVLSEQRQLGAKVIIEFSIHNPR